MQEIDYKLLAERLFFKNYITKLYPSGIASYVSDTFSYFGVLTKIAPWAKEEILNRTPDALGNAKVVFRPDSGDPETIICGTRFYEAECKEYAEEHAKELFYEEQDHGECGQDSESYIFKLPEGYVKVTVSPWWNRHDKQYYYIDGWQETKFEPFEPTAEEKGSLQILWETFGGTITETGHKLLNPRVGIIYGDSITLERANAILNRMDEMGFASANVVFGIGSYTYQYVTRDTFGMAMKSTWCKAANVDIEIYKDPKTDSGTKKSAKGLLQVTRKDNDFILKDQCTIEEEAQGELRTIFENGHLLVDESLATIRARLNSFI